MSAYSQKRTIIHTKCGLGADEISWWMYLAFHDINALRLGKFYRLRIAIQQAYNGYATKQAGDAGAGPDTLLTGHGRCGICEEPRPYNSHGKSFF